MTGDYDPLQETYFEIVRLCEAVDECQADILASVVGTNLVLRSFTKTGKLLEIFFYTYKTEEVAERAFNHTVEVLLSDAETYCIAEIIVTNLKLSLKQP